MSYSEFVNTLVNGCNLIYENISRIANVLIHNYIFITILGLVLFVSLMSIFSDFLIIPLKDIDKKQDKKSDQKYKNKNKNKNKNNSSEPESTDFVEYPDVELSDVEELN